MLQAREVNKTNSIKPIETTFFSFTKTNNLLYTTTIPTTLINHALENKNNWKSHTSTKPVTWVWLKFKNSLKGENWGLKIIFATTIVFWHFQSTVAAEGPTDIANFGTKNAALLKPREKCTHAFTTFKLSGSRLYEFGEESI